MRAGFGLVEITPPMGVELAGYGYYLERRCDSVRDPLYLRAVLIEEGESRQLIVCFDLLGISQELTEKIQREAEAHGIPRDRVMIVSIHTHTGPVVQYHNGCGEVNPEYVASLESKIQPLLEDTMKDLSEVTRLSYIRVDLPGDYLNNRADPNGPVDRQARGFWLEREGMPPILLASAACHGVFLRCVSCVSADFSGELHRRCREDGICSLYLNGLCGDINPWQPTSERMQEFGRQLYDAMRTNRRELSMTLEGGRLPYVLRLNFLSREGIHDVTLREVQKYGGPEAPAARAALAWEREMLEKYDQLRAEEPGEVSFFELGGIPVLALPFEGYTETGVLFRERTHQEDALMLGCAEQLRGYLPTRDDFDRESYAARESMFLYRRLAPQPGEAERLAEQLAEAYRLRRQ